jgi:chemotaxis response regulator CheB
MRAAICSELESHRDFEICYEARNGEEAVLETLRLLPDLVILDIAMPLKKWFCRCS